jgi:hypothetical protein
MQVDVKAFHGGSFQQVVQARVDSVASHAALAAVLGQVAEQPFIWAKSAR